MARLLLTLFVLSLAFASIESRPTTTYHIQVTPSAKHEMTGRQIAQGESVVLGTDFSFDVELYNSKGKVTAGDFVLVFTVLDSSMVPLHTESLDGSDGPELAFQWKLERADFPSGKLGFKFEVQGDAIDYVVYDWSVNLVATELAFEGGRKKLGDALSVSMVPATFVDAVGDLSSEHAAMRKFFLDLNSAAGRRVHTVAGVPSGDKYTFDFSVLPRMDFIGDTIMSFRYESAEGLSYNVMLFDSATQEIFDDQHSMNFTASADLRMVNVQESPSSSTFKYGSVVGFKFQVKDLTSGKLVSSSKRSTVYMALNHNEGSARSFTSAEVAAKMENDFFVINWPVDPNAIRGDGSLSLSGRDADGNDLPILSEKGEPLSYKVNIGGDITFTSKTHSTSDDAVLESVFLVEFTPFCEGVALQGAHLTCSVMLGNVEVDRVPVVSDSQGSYAVSWTKPHSEVKAGSYRLVFYRDVDRRRAIEESDFKKRKLEREARLRGEEASVSSDDALTNVPSFYEMPLHHEKPFFANFLFLRTETLVAIATGAVFFLAFKSKADN